jgi:hypothetical protein
MSSPASSRRLLHLAAGRSSVSRLEEIKKCSDASGGASEIFVLTEETAREAVEKIFSADSVMVWGEL